MLERTSNVFFVRATKQEDSRHDCSERSLYVLKSSAVLDSRTTVVFLHLPPAGNCSGSKSVRPKAMMVLPCVTCALDFGQICFDARRRFHKVCWKTFIAFVARLRCVIATARAVPRAAG